MLSEYFKQNLIRLMRENDLNQSSLARALGMTQGSLNSWITKGQIPKEDRLIQLATFFKIEPYEFFVRPEKYDSLIKYNMNYFVDRLAKQKLTETNYNSYLSAGAHAAYLRILEKNFNENAIEFPEWFLELNKYVNQYTANSLSENLKHKITGRKLPGAVNS